MQLMVFIMRLRQLAASTIRVEHAEDDYCNKLREKFHLVGPYYANDSTPCSVAIETEWRHTIETEWRHTIETEWRNTSPPPLTHASMSYLGMNRYNRNDNVCTQRIKKHVECMSSEKFYP